MPQSTVNLTLPFGVIGEIYTAGPVRAQSVIIHSTDPTNNIFGRGCTYTSQGLVAAGGTGVFAGFLVNPKQVALFGTAGNPLAPSLTVPNDIQIDVLVMGSIWVTISTTAAIGDYVWYNTTTGALQTTAPGASTPAGTLFANAVVDYFTVGVAGLALITATPQNTNP